MRKFFKKLMAVGLSLVTLVSGMSISMGSAAAATQNTTSGQWVTTTVSKGIKLRCREYLRQKHVNLS